MAAFMDLGVSSEGGAFPRSHIELGLRLGYSCFALNTVVEDVAGEKKKKKRQGKEEGVVKKCSHPDRQIVDELKAANCKLKVYSRLTIVMSNSTDSYRMSTADVQSYDLLAVRPTDNKSFHQACGTLEVDIITINMTERLPYHIRRETIGMAIERGVHFELAYGPAIVDSTARRNAIANSQQLISVCKGKNIIMTSQCSQAMHMRGPYDVASIGVMFGLTEPQAKDAVSTNGRAVVLHAETRRTVKAVIAVIPAQPSSCSCDPRPTENAVASLDTTSDRDDHQPLPKKPKITSESSSEGRIDIGLETTDGALSNT